jgi:SAM-dependent methyltransferase
MGYEFKSVPRCNMCGSHDSKLLGLRLSSSQGRNPRRAEGVGISVKKCLDCGLVYSDPLPVPHDIADHYGVPPEDYWHAEYLSWTRDYMSREIEAAKRLLAFRPGMKALDVGVGIGMAVKSLNIAGFDVWGCEPSAPFRTKAIEVMGCDADRIQLAAVEEADYPPGFFDFISFGAVLEHLYDPHAALEKAMAWLKPGGIVHCDVPSADHLVSKIINLYFQLWGTNYVTHLSPMHPPYHLYEFTPRSFRDFQLADHWTEVCTIYNLPRFLHPPLRWCMDKFGSGMQLTVFLRRPDSPSPSTSPDSRR